MRDLIFIKNAGGLIANCLLLALLTGAFPAWGEVVIDGFIGDSEYDYSIADPGGNEVDVMDTLDMISGHISGGSFIYFGWKLYATPYNLDGENDSFENFLRVAIDYNNDGTVDFRVRIDGNDTYGTVYRGANGFLNIAGTFSTFSLTNQPEAAVGWDLFTLADGGASVFSEGLNNLQVRWRVDGGGDSADDSVLTSTTWQPVSIQMQSIPEPGTTAFLGLGAMIVFGLRMKLWLKG